MAVKLLEKDTHCACCGELVKAGEEFRWVEKQVKTGSKVGSYRTAYRPAHADIYCAGKKYERAEATTHAQNLANTVVVMKEHKVLPQTAIEEVRKTLIAEFDKRYLAEFDASHHAELRKLIESA